MPIKPSLVFFTSAFPYGEGEQFIETEIRFLAEAFDTIYIYPLNKEGFKREVPSNVLIEDHGLYRPYNRAKLLKKNAGHVAHAYFYELRKSKHRTHYIKEFNKYFNFLLHRFNDADWFDAIIAKHGVKNTIYYTYWFDIWAQVLSICQLRNKNIPVLSRLHGGDYDEAQKKEGFYPFRYFDMSVWRNLYPVSQFGYNYLKAQFPYYKGKMAVSRLGVKNYGDNPFNNGKEFVIVSCSFMIPLKRIHLVAEVLRHLNLDIKWVHFGSGPLEKDIKNKAEALPANIKHEFKGYVSNSEIISYYASHPVDVFMNVSELEGIPVSIMEAISFGIPVTGCKICGVPEIVNEETGFLLDLNFDPAVVATRLRNYLTAPVEERKRLRLSAKEFWRKEFNADKNYNDFINSHLKPLCAA